MRIIACCIRVGIRSCVRVELKSKTEKYDKSENLSKSYT